MESPRASKRAATFGLVLIGVLMLATLHNAQPPAPVGRNASPKEFSAERAVDMLSRVLGDQTPHPTGSEANRAVRDRLIAELTKMGYTPIVRSRLSCAASGTCATVDNVFTKLPGKGREPGVLLVSHYDSVPAAPGASDDGSGVATLLEVARALKAQARLPRDVWFLFTDGEEMGLLGAEAFVLEPELKQMAIAINFEARGTTGRSRLIETSKGNRGLIAQLSAVRHDPAADSLTYEIYKTLPNDTDLTVFKRTGMPSLGFAYAEGAQRYHTLRDDLEHLDRGSLQDHGNSALPLAREFATRGVRLSDEDVVFFNLPGLFLSWPLTWNLPLLLVGLIGWVALIVRLKRSVDLRVGRFFLATLACFGIVIASLLLGIGLRLALLELGALPSASTAQGAQLVAAFAFIPLALLASLARPCVRRLGAHALAAASFAPFACIAVATVLRVPGGSFVGLLPLLIGVVVANLWPQRVVIWAGALAAGATPVFFNIAVSLYDGLGQATLPGTPTVLAIGFLPLLTVFAAFERPGRVFGVPALAAALAAAALAVVSPTFTRDTPASTMLLFVSRPEDARLHAYAGANQLSPAVAAAGAFEKTPRQLLPWVPIPLFVGKHGPKLAAPVLDLLEDATTPTGRKLTLQLRSTRGAWSGGLRLPSSAGLIEASVQGVNVPAPVGTEKFGRAAALPWRQFTLRPLDAQGARFSIELSKRDALKIQFFDSSPGLPAELRAVAAAREAHVVPFFHGDSTQSWSVLDVPAWQPVSGVQ